MATIAVPATTAQLDRSVPVEFALPDCSDVASIGEYGLQRLNAIIGAYEAFPGPGPRHQRPELPPPPR